MWQCEALKVHFCGMGMRDSVVQEDCDCLAKSGRKQNNFSIDAVLSSNSDTKNSDSFITAILLVQSPNTMCKKFKHTHHQRPVQTSAASHSLHFRFGIHQPPQPRSHTHHRDRQKPKVLLLLVS